MVKFEGRKKVYVSCKVAKRHTPAGRAVDTSLVVMCVRCISAKIQASLSMSVHINSITVTVCVV